MVSAAWEDLRPYFDAAEQVLAENKVIVPHKYCEDFFADQSSHDCMRWDI